MKTFKTSLLTMAVLLCSTTVSAQHFEVDGIYYNITSEENLTVEVTYQGSSYSEYSEYTGYVEIPENVTYGGNTYSVTSIGDETFSACYNLKSVSIPNSVTSIGSDAFSQCSALTSITIPNSVTNLGASAFFNCSSLLNVSLGNSVTSIGESAFSLCSALTDISIPNSVTSIGNRAFSLCSALENVSLGNSVISIGSNAFEYCSALTSITIPNSVTSIGSNAFDSCSALASVSLGNSVTSIGSDAFNRCESLTSVTIPNSVTSIGRNAFLNCSALTHVAIGTSVARIDIGAFSSCPSLTDIVVETGNEVYDSRDNCNAVIETNSNSLVVGCSSTVIPNSVTSIGNSAFSGCTSLTNISIPNSVTSIGMSAFSGCDGLTSIPLGSSVTSIGDYAFSYCVGLTDITVGDAVESIGNYAFENCSKLTSVTIGNTVTSIGDYAFYWCFGLMNVYVGSSVASIGTYAFNCSPGSSVLTYITVDVDNEHYDSRENCNAIIETASNKLIAGGSATVIPNTVTSIGDHAFFGRKSLTDIIIPNSVTSIGASAFGSCRDLKSVVIGSSVAGFGDYAFSDCPKLYTVVNYSTLDITPGATTYGKVAYNAKLVIDGNANTQVGDFFFRTDDSGNHFLSAYIGEESVLTLPENYNGANYGIDSNVFYNHSEIVDVNIPKSVISIKDDAFYGCSSIASIKVEEGNEIYDSRDNCNAIIETGSNTLVIGCSATVIPSTVTIIGNYAFTECKALTSIAIPSAVTNIGENAFLNCSALHTVINYSTLDITAGSTSHGYVAYNANVVIDGNTSVQLGDFYFRTDDNGNHYLSAYVGNASSLTLPENYNGESYKIDTNAFCDHDNLVNVIIPESVTSIGASAFYGCSSLTSVSIPNSVTNIEKYTFQECTALTSINIPNSVTNIGNFAFQNCSSLVSISIPDFVTGIGQFAFESCTALTDVFIGNSVQDIGHYAFRYCSNLMNVTMGNSVSSINASSFDGCSNLCSFTIRASNPFYVLNMASFSSSATLTVPNGSAKAYSDKGKFWGQFATIKEEANIKIPEANKWSTCALAFDAALPEGVRAFVSTGMEDNYVLLEEVTSLTANTPYVLYAQNGYEGTLSGTVDVANYQTSVTDGALNGAIAQQTISEGYVLQNQGEGSKFYNVDGQTFTIPAGKCWLSAVSASGARSVMMRFPGGATDIEGLYVERPVETDGKIYTLDGVEVETMQSGHIYIKDGKKVLKR